MTAVPSLDWSKLKPATKPEPEYTYGVHPHKRGGAYKRRTK